MTEPPPRASAADLVRDPKVLVDTVAPTVLFGVLAAWDGLALAAGASLVWCAGVIAWRVAHRQRLVLAMGGLGGVGLGLVAALATGDAEDFFLPGIVGNIAFGIGSVASILVRRPALAYTSAAIYRWPLGWYFDPRVRPAYSEITWLWAAFYLGKGTWQYALAQRGDLAALTAVRLLLGWPGLVALLVVTYAYVAWRLRLLGAPEVQEWIDARAAEGRTTPPG